MKCLAINGRPYWFTLMHYIAVGTDVAKVNEADSAPRKPNGVLEKQ
jgi:hypothetical protein